jgi:glycosyltransferase involved in cell wall biosynthesis
LTADAVGGVWTYAGDLSRALCECGVQVSLALMGPSPSDAQREVLAGIPGVEVFERPFSLEWMDDPWDELEAAAEWLLGLEKDLHPDVVHLNGFCHAALAWRAPVLVTGHSCVLSWWRAVYGTDAPAKWDRYADAVARGLRAASLVVAPTTAMLAMLDFHYGPLPRTRVIPNGRYATGPAAGQPSMREPLVLTVGRVWDQAKNIEAVRAVAPFISWPVAIAGESRRFGDHGSHERSARCLGRLTSRELTAWMRRASIFALPARYEPFGMSVLEAALGGCALVLGDIRSLREVWGDAALYVLPDNRRALASAIETLIQDEGRREEMVSRALTRARELSPRRMADGYDGAYRDLVREQAALIES